MKQVFRLEAKSIRQFKPMCQLINGDDVDRLKDFKKLLVKYDKKVLEQMWDYLNKICKVRGAIVFYEEYVEGGDELL